MHGENDAPRQMLYHSPTAICPITFDIFHLTYSISHLKSPVD